MKRNLLVKSVRQSTMQRGKKKFNQVQANIITFKVVVKILVSETLTPLIGTKFEVEFSPNFWSDLDH